MDSLQEAFIQPPKPHEALIFIDGCILLDLFWTLEEKHLPVAILELEKPKIHFNMTELNSTERRKSCTPLVCP